PARVPPGPDSAGRPPPGRRHHPRYHRAPGRSGRGAGRPGAAAAGRASDTGTGRCGVTEPMRVGEALPGVLAEVVDRAGQGYDRWAELVAQAGYCHHPIRLAGRVDHADRTTGEVRTVYDSEREPDGVLLKACGTRRESRCPSCAATYRADAYQ